MPSPKHLASAILAMTSAGSIASAQPPGMGGPPGMMMGGPGMMMGGPGMMMGGAPGGEGFGRGGFRGGFDPSSFLSRLDSNGNGSLDPDEMQGPARFMLDRMAQGNPRLDLSKPIPLSTITQEFERMRAERMGGGGGSWGGGGWGGSWGGGEGDDSTGPGAVELVKGFGVAAERTPPPGFGPKAEVSTVKVEPQDLAEAEDRIRRYDRNRDSLLDEEELRNGRWSDNPMQYDRNQDKKLTSAELAVRYARRRLSESSSQQGGDQGRGGEDRRSRGGWGGGWNPSGGGEGGDPGRGGGGESKEATAESAWKDRASFRVANSGSGRTTGLPEWFSRDDANQDGQISMNEFATRWDENVLKEFLRFDTNGDGVITAKECLAAVKNGILRGSSGSSNSSMAAKDSGGAAAGGTPGAGTVPRDGLPEGAEEKWVVWCEKKILEKDANKNGFLSVDEWSASNGDFGKVDADGDGQVSLAEYYIFRRKK